MISRFFYYLLTAYQIALIIRIVSEFFIPDGEENVLISFTRVLTEPILAICEKILSSVGIKNNGPIDLSVIVSLIITSVIKMTLNVLL